MPMAFSKRFDVRNGDYGQYRREVLDEINRTCYRFRQIPVVGPKNDNEWQWFFLELTSGESKIVLAICIDTIYQYAWRKGGLQENFTWAVTKGETVHDLPGDMRQLPFSGNYIEIGNPHTVLISRANLSDSIHILCNCNNMEEAKVAFLRLVVTFCAGIRIKTIYRKIYRILHSGVTGRLSPDDTEREKKWSLASDIYLTRNEAVEVRGYGFMTDETARNYLSVLLNPADCKYDIRKSHGWLPPPKESDRGNKGVGAESRGTSSKKALIRKQNNHPSSSGNTTDIPTRKNNKASEESYNDVLGTYRTQTCNFGTIMESDKVSPARPVWETSNDDDMWQLDDGDDFPIIESSFIPMSEPLEEWPCKFDMNPEQRTLSSQHLVDIIADHDDVTKSTLKGDCSDANGFSFPTDAACKDDDEVTKLKIRAFLDEKALDLKKLQTPLYDEFYNSLNASNAQVISSVCKENMSNNCNNYTTNASKLPPMTPSKNSSAALPTTLLRSGSARNAYDFGASNQIAELATMTAAKSMKGTPYWMAPDVIVQSGHSFSADIWSVGCTVIEMATGKPPWSGQYQEVAALFHVSTTKSHPPILEHLSLGAKDFLLKCLQEEPRLHPTASDLLRHPFVTGELEDAHQLNHAGSKEFYNYVLGTNKTQTCNFGTIMESDKVSPARPVWETSNDDDMWRLDDGDDFHVIGSSFIPMSEPLEEWPCKFDISPEQSTLSSQHLVDIIADHDDVTRSTLKGDCSAANRFSFPSDAACEDDDEVTEFKIRAFLDEKALDLKKLQTPLYEEFYNSLKASNAQVISSVCKEKMSNNCNSYTTNASKLPPMTPSINSSAALPTTLLRSGVSRNASPDGCFICRMSRCSVEGSRILQEITSQKLDEWVPPEHHSDNHESLSPGASFSERRKWKEELDQELERQREMRQATLGRMSSPKSTPLNRKRDRPNNNR